MSQAFDCLLQRSRKKLAFTTAVDPRFTRARPAEKSDSAPTNTAAFDK
jgi:hypothetical protein